MKSEIDLSMRFIVFFPCHETQFLFWKQHWSDDTHNKQKKNCRNNGIDVMEAKLSNS